MRIAWFAQAYNWFVPWKDALFAEIRSSWVWRYGRMLKTRIKLEDRTKPGSNEAAGRRTLWQRWTGRELPPRFLKGPRIHR